MSEAPFSAKRKKLRLQSHYSHPKIRRLKKFVKRSKKPRKLNVSGPRLELLARFELATRFPAGLRPPEALRPLF